MPTRSLTTPTQLTVICCRSDPRSTDASKEGRPSREAAGGRRSKDTGADAAAVRTVLEACGDHPVEFVGRRPGQSIDPLLAAMPRDGRILVVGDDADLAAVALRLLRKDLLGRVVVGYASPRRRTPFTDLWDLPRGARAVELAERGETDVVPLVRDDVGGVMVGVGYLGPVHGTVYVDEKRVLRGAARQLKIEPDPAKGLAVTVTRRRVLGVGRRPETTLGRAVQIGTAPTTVVSDGIPHPRAMDRWTFYKHTEPLRLVRGVL